MNMAAALPLGFSSRCEVMDMKLERDISLEDLPARLNGTLPSGLQVVGVEQVDERDPALQTQVDAAEYEVTLTEPIEETVLRGRIGSVMEATALPRERRGKQYDLRPLIEELSLRPDDRIFMRLTAREGATGRPEEVLDALGIAFEGTRIERTRLVFKNTKARQPDEDGEQPEHSAESQ
jgi:radical SAM-linked protein